jgi:predicted O-methyltransferase YrrM
LRYFRRVILSPAVESYLDDLRPAPDPVLADMEEHAAREGIPIVVPQTGQLLAVLAAATGARRIVEVGTAIGVSTLYLARGAGPEARIVTFDVDRERLDAARGYLDRAGVLDRVELRLQDGRAGLAELEPATFDLAFIDALKQQYGDYLEATVPLLRPGGLVAVDNVLMSGAVAAGRGDGQWTDDQVATARAFNERLLSHPELMGTVTPVGDGVALAVKRAPAA